MRISVVVPSYHRPDALVFCLRALEQQRRLADEVIVVIRDDDDESRDLLSSHPSVSVVTVTKPGAVFAMTQGALSSTGDVIAFTDDDARPRADWLARIEATFDANPSVAAVGGRDVIHDAEGVPRPMSLSTDVGRLTWFGRLIGNHHRGRGGPRDVVVLKGVNSSYRRSMLGLPEGLRGKGTQIHFEVAMGLRIILLGGTLRYDPSILVDHYPAERQDADKRAAPPASSIAGYAYNLTTSVAMLGPVRLAIRYAYGIVIGDAAMPGFARAFLLVVRREPHVGARLRGALSGNTAALWDAIRGRRPRFLSPPPLAEAHREPSSQ